MQKRILIFQNFFVPIADDRFPAVLSFYISMPVVSCELNLSGPRPHAHSIANYIDHKDLMLVICLLLAFLIDCLNDRHEPINKFG